MLPAASSLAYVYMKVLWIESVQMLHVDIGIMDQMIEQNKHIVSNTTFLSKELAATEEKFATF